MNDDRRLPTRVHVGIIVQATTETPGLPSTIQYAATSIGDAYREISVPLSTPIGGRPVEETDQIDIRPAAIGDPCLIVEFAADAPGIVVLTERLFFEPCPVTTT